jgi:hypothetical protein
MMALDPMVDALTTAWRMFWICGIRSSPVRQERYLPLSFSFCLVLDLKTWFGLGCWQTGIYSRTAAEAANVLTLLHLAALVDLPYRLRK